MAEKYQRGRYSLIFFLLLVLFFDQFGINRFLKNANESVLKLIVGNKCDLESLRVVPTCYGEELSAKFGIPFYEVSAKENINVKNAFNSLASQILKNVRKSTFNSRLIVQGLEIASS